jgi:hypothetical protein
MADKKMGPTEMQEEVERLRAAGLLPALEDILDAVGEARKKYAKPILEARKKGEDSGT